MAEELKTDTDEQSINVTGAKVALTQAELDSLINSKFAKGAEKATKSLLETLGVEDVDTLKATINKQKEVEEANKTEVQKALDKIKKKEDELLNVKRELDSYKTKATISSIALQNGVKDLDYLEFEYQKQVQTEGFNIASFVNSLRETKPYLFEKTQVKTDTSNNKGDPRSLEERVKNAKTQKELDALYNEYLKKG